MPGSVSLEDQATWLLKVFVLRNIVSITVKTTSSPDKHCWSIINKHWPTRCFQRIVVSKRKVHCTCPWATQLRTDLKPEQHVIQTENIKTLNRTSPKGLLLPRQWTQPAELAEPGWFCPVPDLPQGREVLHKANAPHGPRQTPQTTYSSPRPHSPTMNQSTSYCLNAGRVWELLGPDLLPSNLLFQADHLHFPPARNCLHFQSFNFFIPLSQSFFLLVHLALRLII